MTADGITWRGSAHTGMPLARPEGRVWVSGFVGVVV
jgi:hypothetical protein